MKRLIAVLLLGIYLFSLGGQLALHQYFSVLSDKFFTEQTGKGLYNVGDLTEVKLPLNMPAITDWKHYENIKGCIEFDNVSYNYVKMKITRTALYLMCIPDYNTTRFSTQNVVDAKKSKSVPVPKKEHVPFGKATLLGNFNIAFAQFSFSSFAKTMTGNPAQTSIGLLTPYRDIPRQPPKTAC
ncbi:MAG TPA: hypothetical protein VFE53_18455 [Mucilaginibacter sp.]|nr:hypothetical protein [Mucilaginibacter sp.]